MRLIFTDTCSINKIYILVTKFIAIRVIQGTTYTEFSIRLLPTLLTAIMAHEIIYTCEIIATVMLMMAINTVQCELKQRTTPNRKAVKKGEK